MRNNEVAVRDPGPPKEVVYSRYRCHVTTIVEIFILYIVYNSSRVHVASELSLGDGYAS